MQVMRPHTAFYPQDIADMREAPRPHIAFSHRDTLPIRRMLSRMRAMLHLYSYCMPLPFEAISDIICHILPTQASACCMSPSPRDIFDTHYMLQADDHIPLSRSTSLLRNYTHNSYTHLRYRKLFV